MSYFIDEKLVSLYNYNEKSEFSNKKVPLCNLQMSYFV